MKATGIVRRIDDLGRVIIPKEIRRSMGIKDGDPWRFIRTLIPMAQFLFPMTMVMKWPKKLTIWPMNLTPQIILIVTIEPMKILLGVCGRWPMN